MSGPIDIGAANRRSPKRAQCIDPATDEALGDARVMDAREVAAAVRRARDVQPRWSDTPVTGRIRAVAALLLAVAERQDELCRLAAHGTGKTMLDVAVGEALPLCQQLQYLVEHGAADLRPRRTYSGLLGRRTTEVGQEPRGVVAVLCGPNAPLVELLAPAARALLAGNAVVAHIEAGAAWPVQAYLDLLGDVVQDEGGARDLVQLVTGDAHSSRALQHAADFSVQAEHSPTTALVCADADIDCAVEAALWCGLTGRAGAAHFVVCDPAHDAFVQAVQGRAAGMRQGPPLDDEPVDCGALPRAAVEQTQALVAEAVEAGAEVVEGGVASVDLGSYLRPTVVCGVRPDMRIARVRPSAPVVLVTRAANEDEAIAMINGGPRPAVGAVVCGDPARAAALARRLDVTACAINDSILGPGARAASSGPGASQTEGRDALLACCRRTVVISDTFSWRAAAGVVRHHPQTYELVEGAVRAAYGPGVRARATAAVDTVRRVVNAMRRRS